MEAQAKKEQSIPFVGRLALSAVVAGAYLAYLMVTYGDWVWASLERPPLATPAAPAVPASNLLAVVTPDGAICTISPEGAGAVVRITGEAEFSKPFWSYDGRWLGFCEEGEGAEGIYVTPADRAAPALVAKAKNSFPIYACWAPDSRRISYLAAEGGQKVLRLLDVRAPEQNRSIVDGFSCYFTWTHDGQRLVINRNNALCMSIAPETSEVVFMGGGVGLSPHYQAPQWSEPRNRAYFASFKGISGGAIQEAAVTGYPASEVSEVAMACRMAIAPDGAKLAWLTSDSAAFFPSWPLAGRVYVTDLETRESQQIPVEGICFMQWSPDGEKLLAAAFTHVPSARSREDEALDCPELGAAASESLGPMRLKAFVYNVADERIAPLCYFRAPRETRRMIHHFTQYLQSHTFWSPDSRSIALPVEELADDPQIYILDAEGKAAPRSICAGNFVTWSWT